MDYLRSVKTRYFIGFITIINSLMSVQGKLVEIVIKDKSSTWRQIELEIITDSAEINLASPNCLGFIEILTDSWKEVP